MDFKIGMYVRLYDFKNKGVVGKIKYIDEITRYYNNSKITFIKYLLDNGVFLSSLADYNEGNCKASYNLEDLIEVNDLLYVDIDNGYEGGIIVPRIAETLCELAETKSKISSGEYIIKRIITREQLYNLGFDNNEV